MDQTGKEMIVVFPDGFNSFYVNQSEGMEMEDAIIKDLIPYMDKVYNTSLLRSQRAIGGISMGGYGAARFSLKYPKLFSKSVLISPAVSYRLSDNNEIKMTYHAFAKDGKSWSDEFYQSLHPSNYIESRKDIDFYIRTAREDEVVDVRDVERFVSELDKKSIKNEFIIDSDKFGHNWDYWAYTAEDFYGWILESFYESRK